MNSSLESESIIYVAGLISEGAKWRSAAEQTKPVINSRRIDRKVAQEILSLSGKAKVIEDLIFLEESFQKFDVTMAKSEQDRNSITTAQRNYRQLTLTVTQMRKDPEAYFYANMRHKETGGDYKQIVKGNSLDFITGNVTRMRNRKAFASKSECEIWDARIALANKTASMFKALHDTLAADFQGE